MIKDIKENDCIINTCKMTTATKPSKLILKKNYDNVKLNIPDRFNNTLKIPLFKTKSPKCNTWLNDNKLTSKNPTGAWGVKCGSTNNITVVDYDSYKWKDDHIFNTEILKGRTFEEYIKDEDTYSVKTTSGGYHLYYEYTDEISTRNCPTTEIDIKSEGGYVVGVNSWVKNKQGKMKQYKCINDTDVKPMPDDLIKWIEKNVGSKSDKLKSKNRKKRLGNITQKTDTEEIPVEVYRNTVYDFNDTQLKWILDNLPKRFILKHENWVMTCRFFKLINQEEFFLDYCLNHPETHTKSKDDHYYKRNKEQMDAMTIKCIQTTEKIIMEELPKDKLRILFNYHKYNKTINLPFTKDPISMELLDNQSNSNKDSLGVEKVGFGLEYNPDINYAIKSDTGTGKTTWFMNSMIEETDRLITEDENYNGCSFISVVSRVSLADDQYRKFNENGLACEHYKAYTQREEDSLNPSDFSQGNSMIAQVDSLIRFDIDYSDYIVFLDEFNSMVLYITEAEYLKEKRGEIFNLFIRMLKTCKQIILADADLSQNTLQFLDMCEIDYELHINKFIHNTGVEAIEQLDCSAMYTEFYNLDALMFCSDSSGTIKTVWNSYINYMTDTLDCKLTYINNEKKEIDNPYNTKANFIKLEFPSSYINNEKKRERKTIYACRITQETKEPVVLDEFDIVMYSPKIVYGVDSIMVRPVYCAYTGETISPDGMLQQITRNRNITKLVFNFSSKSYTKCEVSLEDIKILDDKKEEIYKYKNTISEKTNKIYRTLLTQSTYNNKHTNTNKFAYFIKKLKIKGFNIKCKYEDSKGEEFKNEKIDTSELAEYEFNPSDPIYKKRKDYFKMKSSDMCEYKELFMGDSKYFRYKTMYKYFLTEPHLWAEKIDKLNEFPVKKVNHVNSKLLFLQSVMTKLDMVNKIDLMHTKGLASKDESIKLYEQYIITFGKSPNTKRDYDLTNPANCSKFVAQMYKDIFGMDFIIKNRSYKKTHLKDLPTDTSSVMLWSINIDMFNRFLKVLSFSKTIKQNPCWEFGKEGNIEDPGFLKDMKDDDYEPPKPTSKDLIDFKSKITSYDEYEQRKINKEKGRTIIQLGESGIVLEDTNEEIEAHNKELDEEIDKMHEDIDKIYEDIHTNFNAENIWERFKVPPKKKRQKKVQP